MAKIRVAKKGRFYTIEKEELGRMEGLGFVEVGKDGKPLKAVKLDSKKVEGQLSAKDKEIADLKAKLDALKK